jgi:hypothetical protein
LKIYFSGHHEVPIIVMPQLQQLPPPVLSNKAEVEKRLRNEKCLSEKYFKIEEEMCTDGSFWWWLS